MKKIIIILLVILILGCSPEIKTEIREEGQRGLEIVISPTNYREITGSVQISLNNAPQDIVVVGFSVEDPDSDGMGSGPNIGWDRDGSDGWSSETDSTTLQNSQYMFYAVTYNFDPGPNSEPTAGARTLATVKNPIQEFTFTRDYPEVIKGNLEPSSNYMKQVLDGEVDALKEVGVNTVSIFAGYNLNKDGSYYLQDEMMVMTNLINAKKAGFAVLLAPDFVGGYGHDYAGEGVDIDLERFLQLSEEVALKWAKIAEEYQVEFFAPQSEFNGPIEGNFGTIEESSKITTDWHAEMLPKIKEVYSGKLIAKIDQPREGILVPGYDYLGITIGHGYDTVQRVQGGISQIYSIAKDIGEKSDVTWMVTEGFFQYGGHIYPRETNNAGESLDELQDDYFRASIEEYEELGGRDYIFDGWIMDSMVIKDRPAEKVIKDFFEKR